MILNSRDLLIALLAIAVAVPAFAENPPDDHGRGRPAPASGPSRGGPQRGYPSQPSGPSRGPERGYPSQPSGPSRGPERGYPSQPSGPSRGPERGYPAPTPVYGPSRGPERRYPAPAPVYVPGRVYPAPAPVYVPGRVYPAPTPVYGPVRVYPAPVVYGPNRGYPAPGYGVRIIENRGELRYENDRCYYHPLYPIIYRAPIRTYYRDPAYDFDREIYELINRGSVQRLGATYLSESNDYEVIPVRECGIRQIQIRIRNNDVNIDHIVAVYENGTSQQLDVNEYYQEGSFSPWKDLPGYSSCVREVIVVGATVNSANGYRQQAEVEIYGLK